MITDFAALERALWIANFVLECGLVAWLWRQGLYRAFRFFWLYLLVDAAVGIVIAFLPPRSDWYGNLYFAAEFSKLGLLFGVVLANWRATLERYPSIAALGRKAIQLSFGLAIVLSVLAASLEANLPKGEFPLLIYTLVTLRSGLFALAVATILSFLFLSWFPVRISRNSVRFLSIFVLYLASKAAFYFGLNYLGFETRRVFSDAILGLSSVCMLLWILGLRRDGEYVSAVVAVRNPQREQVLVAQLDAINASLSRIAGK